MGEPCTWGTPCVCALLRVVRAIFDEEGEYGPIQWLDVAPRMTQETGHIHAPKVCRNRFEYARKEWRLWSKLRSSNEGINWDRTTGMIIGDDAWWAEILKVTKHDCFICL